MFQEVATYNCNMSGFIILLSCILVTIQVINGFRIRLVELLDKLIIISQVFHEMQPD